MLTKTKKTLLKILSQIVSILETLYYKCTESRIENNIGVLSIEDSSTKAWINAKTLRLVYQNLLVEQNIDVLNLSAQVYEKLLLEMNNNKFNIDVIFTKQSKSLLTLTMTLLVFQDILIQ